MQVTFPVMPKWLRMRVLRGAPHCRLQRRDNSDDRLTGGGLNNVTALCKHDIVVPASRLRQ
jgi:hypothetical protein